MVQFPQCMDCKNFIEKKDDVFRCKAYPEGIPMDIFWNKISHEQNIEGDRGYRYEDLNMKNG